MDVQQAWLFGVTLGDVKKALVSSLAPLGYRDSGQSPLLRPSGTAPTFAQKNRRFFFISEFESRLVSVVENGELFDASLVKEVSEQLRCRGVWVALHESLNAWGHQEFVAGNAGERALFPEEAFSDSAEIEDVDYAGDATREAFAYVETLDAPEAFVGYGQISKGFERPSSLKTCIHVAMSKLQS